MSDPAARPKPRTRITLTGWLWFGATGVMFGTGLYKGIKLLALLAYWLLILGVLNYLIAGRQLRHLRLHRWVGDAVFAGEPFTFLVELENPDAKPHVGLRVEDRGAGHEFAWFVSCLRARERVRRREALTLPRRGWYDWPATRLVSGYPFGLWESSAPAASDRPFLVYPALGRINRGRLRQFLARAVPVSGRARLRPEHHPAAQSEFHGLRDFRNGDSPRWIHWRTSARRGTLMVREFEDNPADDLILVLDPWLPAPPAADAPLSGGAAREYARACRRLEAAVSLTATVCWEWCRQKGDRLVLAVAGAAAPLVLDGVTGREHARLMLECLALLEGAAEIDPAPLLERLAHLDLPAAPALVISTRPGDLADRLAARLHRPVAALDVADLKRHGFYEGPQPARQPAAARRDGGV